MELTERKKQILKFVVERYIATAEPLGSKAIAEAMPEKISSATVRNEMAELGEMGYLEQPHTSAGRIPSAAGYRLYVNELMERHSLSSEERKKITASLHQELKQSEQVVAKAGQMVQRFVEYPTYTAAPRPAALTVRRFELIAAEEGSFIAVAMLSNSRVKSRLLTLTLAVETEKLPEMSHLLNTHFVNIDAEQMNAKLMSLSEQVSPEWFLLLNQVVEYASELLQKAQEPQVNTCGASRLLSFPEFRDIDKAQGLMRFMVDKKENLPLPADNTQMQIWIGPENVSEELRESSVVVASYDIGDGMRGLIGVVGPTRMDYATVAARLSYFAESLTRMFGKRELPSEEDTEDR